MRGYRLLKQSGQLDRIAAVKQALTEHPLGLTTQKFSSVVMGCGAAFGEIIVRQYLLVRVGGTNLNRAILFALGKDRGKVVFPLPKEWREVLTQYNYEVAHFRSALLWQLYVCALLFYGVLKIGKIALAGLTCPRSSDPKPKRHVHFVDLGPGNLPQEAHGSRSHDVMSWYLRWQGRIPGIEAIFHTVAKSSPVAVGDIQILARNGPLPDLMGWRPVLHYVIWGVRATTTAMVDCLRGRWWHAFLLNQAASAAHAILLPDNFLADEYLFHNSGWIFRPLWTYEVERRGSAISFYFYSTNCEAFKRQDGYPPMNYGWKAMNWSRYLVWDVYQANFVRSAVGAEAKVVVVGPIWFQSSAEPMPPIPQKKGIAVFDVTPFRSSKYQTMGLDSEYYVPGTTVTFLSDIQKCAESFSYTLIWKRKRDIGLAAHPKYRTFSNRFLESRNVLAIDPDISAHRVIEECAMVISMPFTSTALIGREMGKPSCYYDPHFVIQEDDRAAHGISIIRGRNDLMEWIRANDSITEIILQESS